MKRGQLFRDLAVFARIEVESGDLEPWAALLKGLSSHLEEEDTLWLVNLYNTYDSMSSAWGVYRRWGHPLDWLAAKDREEARDYPCMQERRNLHGGRVNKRHESYANFLDDQHTHPQEAWLVGGMSNKGPEASYTTMMDHVRKIWGVGRQAAFEWVEFLEKVNGYHCHAPTAELWESSGPRHSLEILYEDPNPSPQVLDEYADDCRDWLRDEHGIDLPWEDFETVICDFKVMQKGRYYPGRHLAALRGEIEEIGGKDGKLLLKMFKRIIPEPWNEISPGIDKALMPLYRQTGKIHTPFDGG